MTDITTTQTAFGRARVREAMQRAVKEMRQTLKWEADSTRYPAYYAAAEDELQHMERIVADGDAGALWAGWQMP